MRTRSKKKNNDTLTDDFDTPLPTLVGQQGSVPPSVSTAPASAVSVTAATSIAAAAVAPAPIMVSASVSVASTPDIPTSVTVSAPVSQPISVAAAPDVSVPASVTTSAPIAASDTPITSSATIAPCTAPSATTAPGTAPRRRSISISGSSIGSLLNVNAATDEPAEDEEGISHVEDSEQDQNIESKLEKGCAQLAREFTQSRPRLGVVFEDVDVTGNTVSLKVPNESLYDELMNSLSDISRQLSMVSATRCPIEFNVSIVDDIAGVKPFKAEDKLSAMIQKNPNVITFCKELGLDIE